jgi:hypothetical protein
MAISGPPMKSRMGRIWMYVYLNRSGLKIPKSLDGCVDHAITDITWAHGGLAESTDAAI